MFQGRLLTADIGGSHSRFALFDFVGDAFDMTASLWLNTQGASSFKELHASLPGEFHEKAEKSAAFVCALPGLIRPRTDEIVLPNVPWNVSKKRDGEVHDRVIWLNDFQAQAYGCLTEAAQKRRAMQSGVAVEEGVTAVIGAGTGLGHSALIPVDGRLHALASEAGHAAFPFHGKAEMEYAAYRLSQDGAVPDGDAVVSGRGLEALHAFLTGAQSSAAEIGPTLKADDETTRCFARFYGRATRHWALATAAAQVVTLGGVASKCPLLIESPEFLAAFRGDDAYADALGTIPVWFNGHSEIGLYGAAQFGKTLLQQQWRTGDT